MAAATSAASTLVPNDDSARPLRIQSEQHIGRLRMLATKARYNIAEGIHKTTPNLDPKPKHEDSPEKIAGELHDLFNILALPVIVFFIVLNMDLVNGTWWRFWWLNVDATIASTYFYELWFATLTYFLIDVIWVICVPICVKSPPVIIIHHIVTLLYMLIPFQLPQFGWMMGACLIVEVNTWFLIMRRYGNRRADVPWSEGVPVIKSIRIQIVVAMFYSTWVLIRLVLYPVMLPLIVREYQTYSGINGWFNQLMWAPLLHTVFIFLNFKWSYDLFFPPKRAPSVSNNQVEMERGL